MNWIVCFMIPETKTSESLVEKLWTTKKKEKKNRKDCNQSGERELLQVQIFHWGFFNKII